MVPQPQSCPHPFVLHGRAYACVESFVRRDRRTIPGAIMAETWMEVRAQPRQQEGVGPS